MHTFTDEEFEDVVADAIDSLPDRFAEELDNVAFFIWDEVPDYLVDEDGIDPETLGLYDGLPLTERDSTYGAFDEEPDIIIVFKGPHERLEGTREEICEEVRRTIVHEVGHYFGMTEEQIEAMGYE